MVPGTVPGDFSGTLRGLLGEGRVSTIIGAPGDYRPLILDGGYLYHQRMLYYEDRLVRALRDRLKLPDSQLDSERVRRALASTLQNLPMLGGGAGRMRLNCEQQYALLSAVHRPFTVISGGPGTGKTSIVVSLLRMLARLGIEPEQVALAAPTGKAAHRLGQSVQTHLAAIDASGEADDVDARLLSELDGARTLHRLLGYSPARNDYYYHENNRLPHRVVIVDEASMIDLFLMERLVSAVDPSARFILLGDADQLPSVDAGAVFRDLVPARVDASAPWAALIEGGTTAAESTGSASGAPMSRHAVRLTTSYRMDPKSPAGGDILRAAQALNRGEVRGLFDDSIDGASGPIQVRESFDEVEGAGVEMLEPTPDAPALDPVLLNGFVDWWYGRVLAALIEFRDLIQRSFEFDGERFSEAASARLARLFEHFASFQVLAVTRVFATGSEQLNAAFHARHLRFLGRSFPGQEAAEFAVGEPIIMLQNDYARGLFNGDQGLILDVVRVVDGIRRVQTMAVFRREGEFVPFGLRALRPQIEHAFALTIHKAQGSEFNAVGIVLPAENLPLLTREILYTGMTRSRRSVLLVGGRERLTAASKNAVRRFSGIASKL
jgi:exodeoxyribonuclease V alpha subunit